jgi:hypothetical protein
VLTEDPSHVLLHVRPILIFVLLYLVAVIVILYAQ